MKIHAIQTGTVAIKTRQRSGKGEGFGRLVNTLLDPEWTPMLPIYAWVIEHPEGVIVVDTGETARTRVHLLRAQCDAILVGIGTVQADDPLLTCRLPGMEARSPVRVVLDRALRTPGDSRLVHSARHLQVQKPLIET